MLAQATSLWGVGCGVVGEAVFYANALANEQILNVLFAQTHCNIVRRTTSTWNTGMLAGLTIP